MKYRVEIVVTCVARLKAIIKIPGVPFAILPDDEVITATYACERMIQSNCLPRIGEWQALTDDFGHQRWFKVTNVLHCDRGTHPVVIVEVWGNVVPLESSDFDKWPEMIKRNAPSKLPSYQNFRLENIRHGNAYPFRKCMEEIRFVDTSVD
jgi:hypothetical protein